MRPALSVLYFISDDMASLDNQLSTSSLHVMSFIHNHTLKLSCIWSGRCSNSVHLYSYSAGDMAAILVGKSVGSSFLFWGGTASV